MRRRRQRHCRRGTHSQALRHGRQFRSMSCARRGCRKPEKPAASLSYAPGRRALARARFTPHSRTPRCCSTGGSEGVRGGKACDSTASRFKTSRHSKRLNCGPRSTSRPAAPKPLDNWRRPARPAPRIASSRPAWTGAAVVVWSLVIVFNGRQDGRPREASVPPAPLLPKQIAAAACIAWTEPDLTYSICVSWRRRPSQESNDSNCKKYPRAVRERERERGHQ